MPTIPSPEKPAGISPLSPAPSNPLKSGSSVPSIMPNLVDTTASKINL
jgi:hypothetical protein